MQINKLKAKMVELGYTQEDIAKQIGLSNSSLNLRMTERVDFKLPEIVDLQKVLNLTNDDVIAIFFED